MSPRTGRPRLGVEPKDRRIAFRVADLTIQKFNECARLSQKKKVDLFEEMVDHLHAKLTAKK